MKIEFTVIALKNLKIPAGKEKMTLTDLGMRGLQYELRKSGGHFNYRYTFQGIQKSIPIGPHTYLSISDARKRAMEFGRLIALGQDPVRVKQDTTQCPNLQVFFERKYLAYAKAHKRSWATDNSLYRNHLQQVFGSVQMNQVTNDKVMVFLQGKKMSGSASGTINRMLVLLRYFYNLAVKWQILGVKENPTKGIRLFKENNKIDRYLSEEESLALKLALVKSKNRLLRYIVGFLLVTGARKQEALKAEWAHIDWAAKVWRIPLSKSGKVRHIVLSQTALDFLILIKQRNAELLGQASLSCAFVFPNPATRQPFQNIFYAWNTARRLAGLPDVRIHDLRHTFASTLVNQGVALYEVQKLLGHANIKTTERYAHLAQGRLQESASLAGKTFAHILQP
jgi:site-specific recombinase XerD